MDKVEFYSDTVFEEGDDQKIPHKIRATGFSTKFAYSYVSSKHGGACALSYKGKEWNFEEWSMFSSYRYAKSAASIACSPHLGGYDEVFIYPLIKAPTNIIRYNTASDWFLEENPSSNYEKYPSITMVRDAMRQAIREIVKDPNKLIGMHYYDVERALSEALAGLGYKVHHTPASRDGGYDFLLEISGHNYLIEVKNWSPPKKVGMAIVKKFADVVLSKNAKAGLVLSSSGFGRHDRFIEFKIQNAPVILGGIKKIMHICDCYVKSENGVWNRDGSLVDTFFTETVNVKDYKSK